MTTDSNLTTGGIPEDKLLGLECAILNLMHSAEIEYGIKFRKIVTWHAEKGEWIINLDMKYITEKEYQEALK